MQLSYTNRLICLAFCSAGILQLALEWIAWTFAPRLLEQNSGTNARRTERSLFLLVLIARLSPWLIALGAWLPAYVRGEDNLSAERVGLLPLAAAFCFFGFGVFGCIRFLHSLVVTQRYCRQCKPAGFSPEGLPILLHPSPHPLLAVAGLFRPRILVSQSLLAPDRFSAAALQVAYRHESAHALHRDNLKRAVLSLLPHFFFATRRRPSLEQHWLLAAELAADEAGAMGVPERSILLADLLVKMARETMPPAPLGAFALLSHADDLQIRIERLLPAGAKSSPPAAERSRLTAPGLLLIACTGVAVLCYLAVLAGQAGHRLAELLLHIG